MRCVQCKEGHYAACDREIVSKSFNYCLNTDCGSYNHLVNRLMLEPNGKKKCQLRLIDLFAQ